MRGEAVSRAGWLLRVRSWTAHGGVTGPAWAVAGLRISHCVVIRGCPCEVGQEIGTPNSGRPRHHCSNVLLMSDRRRYESPPLERPLPEPRLAVARASPLAKKSAALLIRLRGLVDLQPTVEHLLVFEDGGGHIVSSWFVVSRHYSQLWCARATLARREDLAAGGGDMCDYDGLVDAPVFVLKLLTVLQTECHRSAALLPEAWGVQVAIRGALGLLCQHESIRVAGLCGVPRPLQSAPLLVRGASLTGG